MTVAHKDLTGTDLHEIKGASSATSGQVPISDGAGTTPFGKLTHTSLQTTGNPFGAQLLHIREEQTNGTNSTNSFSTGWNTVVLNTIVTNEISASLSANVFTIPAGTYYIRAITPATQFNDNLGNHSRTKARIYNSGLSSTILVGRGNLFTNRYSPGSAEVEGRFTVAGSTQIRLQAYWAFPNTVIAIGAGEIEVYGEVFLWKLA